MCSLDVSQPPASVDYIGPLPSWRGQIFLLTGLAEESASVFSFYVYNASVSTTICGFIEYFIHCHGILLLYCS